MSDHDPIDEQLTEMLGDRASAPPGRSGAALTAVLDRASMIRRRRAIFAGGVTTAVIMAGGILLLNQRTNDTISSADRGETIEAPEDLVTSTTIDDSYDDDDGYDSMMPTTTLDDGYDDDSMMPTTTLDDGYDDDDGYDSMMPTTTLDDGYDDDGYDDDGYDDDGYDDDSRTPTTTLDDGYDDDGYDDDGYDDDSMSPTTTLDDGYDDDSMMPAEVQEKTFAVSCVGDVTVKFAAGRIMDFAYSAPGWDTKIDKDWNKLKIEFLRYQYGYESKAMIEIVLDGDQFETTIEDASDDCYEPLVDETEMFEVPGVGTVVVQFADGHVTGYDLSVPGWDTKIDKDWNKLKIEFFRYEGEYEYKAMIEIVLDEDEFKVKIETDFP